MGSEMMGYELNTTEATAGLAALLERATPGPWAVERNKFTWGWVDVVGPSFNVGGPTQATDLMPRDEANRLADAALIARAPDLAAEVLRLTAAVTDLTAQSREDAMQYLSDTGQMMEQIADLTAANAALVAENARLVKRVEERKFYHTEWSMSCLLAARNGGLLTDKGEAWRYSHTGMDGEGGKYDLLYRRGSDAARAYLAGGAE